MEKNKKELIRFAVWTRNGIAFCTTWLLIILLVYNHLFNIPNFTTGGLTKFVILTAGGVLIFNFIFTRLFIKKLSFTGRLTCFMGAISLYECFGFYWIGFFKGKGTLAGWAIFAGIILVLYFICIAIYKIYSKRKGELYTKGLREYQLKRSIENGK